MKLSFNYLLFSNLTHNPKKRIKFHYNRLEWYDANQNLDCLKINILKV